MRTKEELIESIEDQLVEIEDYATFVDDSLNIIKSDLKELKRSKAPSNERKKKGDTNGC